MEIENRELQIALLNMIKEYHRICTENDFVYYMLGGTCLGAIRHKGFIPWDDDMDVGMPRRDYDLFCAKASTLLPEHLELKYYKNTDKSPFHYAKLINKNTTLIEPKYTDYVEGIYIDVFPLDNLSTWGIKERLRYKNIIFKHASVMNYCSTEKKKGLVRCAFQKYSKCCNLQSLHESLERLMVYESEAERGYLCNFLGAWKEKEIIPYNVFGKPQLYPFEDMELCGPTDADAYLRSLYGEYMILPPKEKQVCRHNYYYVNLNLPYKTYSNELSNKEYMS